MSEFSADAATTRSERFSRKCTLDYLFISIVQYPYCNKFIDLSTAIGVLARVKRISFKIKNIFVYHVMCKNQLRCPLPF